MEHNDITMRRNHRLGVPGRMVGRAAVLALAMLGLSYLWHVPSALAQDQDEDLGLEEAGCAQIEMNNCIPLPLEDEGDTELELSLQAGVANNFGALVDVFRPRRPGRTPVGLEHDGTGRLIVTDFTFLIATIVKRINTAGQRLNFLVTLGSSIGVTTDGSFLYLTQTAARRISVYQLDGTFVRSFSVAGQTAFPEGLTYNPNTGHLYLVAGAGEDIVSEYELDGTHVQDYPINGNSPDGIAYDPDRNGYWIYDSGTSLVRFYDAGFNQLASFPGPGAYGPFQGEGVAVIGNTVYVAVANVNRIAAFDVTAPTDLALTKDDGDAVAVPGGVLTYHLTYDNLGIFPANGVAITEHLPPNTTFEAAASTPGWQLQPDGSYLFPVGNLASGAGPIQVDFAVRLANTFAAGVDTIDNTATIADGGGAGEDGDPIDNTATTQTPLAASPNLVVTKMGPPASGVPGISTLYHLTYQNVGTQDATGVVLIDHFPDYLTFEPTQSTPGWHLAPGGGYELNLGMVPAGGGPIDVTFAVNIPYPFPAGIEALENAAGIRDDGDNGADINPVDNAAYINTGIVAAPDLMVTKTDDDVVATPGTVLVYHIAYSNGGNQHATGVLLREQLPEHTTFDAANSTPGWQLESDGTYTFPIGDLDVGAGPFDVHFAVLVDADVPLDVLNLENVVTIRDDGRGGTEGDLDNNTSTLVTSFGRPDLVLQKSDGDVTATPDAPLVYQLTYSNAGTATAAGVVIEETLPANTTFVETSSTAGWQDNGDGTFSFDVGDLAAGGDPVTITFAVQPVSPFPASASSVVNTASIHDDGTGRADLNPEDNQASVETAVESSADVSVETSVALVGDVDGDGEVDPGDRLHYTIVTSVGGNAIAMGLTANDDLDENLRLVPGSVMTSQGMVTSGRSAHDSSVSIEVGDVSPPALVNIAFDVVVADGLDPDVGIVQNVAQVAGSNVATAVSNVIETGIPRADLNVEVTAEEASVVQSRALVLTLRVANDGPDPAMAVQMTAFLPQGLTVDHVGEVSGIDAGQCSFDAATDGAGHTGTGALCTLPEFATGASFAVQLFVRGDDVGNHVVRLDASSTRNDPDPSANASSVEVAVQAPIAPPNLAGGQAATPGDGAFGVSLPVLLSWGLVDGATFYHLQVSEAPFDGGSSSAQATNGSAGAHGTTAMIVDVDTLGTPDLLVEGLEGAHTYYWRVASIDADGIEGSFSGTFTFNTASGVGTERVSAELPTTFELQQNYPNPFNPETVIPFGLPEASRVRLAVYDVLGREVAVLAQGRMAAGRYEARWDASRMPSGLYVYRLETDRKTISRTLTLMR